ncbi:MAG: putative transporter [Verrucomicrobiales bacterium]|nr:putative transporter [Verrucomicrobiales bacterium]
MINNTWQDWHELFPVALDLLLLCVVALIGIGIGRISFGGVRLGIAGVLFSGLIAAHFGFRIDTHVAHFTKELGLILFVFSLGLQMGNGFFASLRKEGLKLNLYAVAIIGLGALITLVGAKLLGLPMAAAAGVFSGGTTNTPSLGAAQQALSATGDGDPVLAAMAYAAAYPLAVVGIIGTLLILKRIFGINMEEEKERFQAARREEFEPLVRMNLTVENPNLAGLKIGEIPGLHETEVIASRIRRKGETEIQTAGLKTVLSIGDTLMVVGTGRHVEKFRLVVGAESNEDLMEAPGEVSFRRVVMTNEKVIGKSVKELGLDALYGVTVTRVTRQEHPFTALPEVRLQFGDHLQIVGPESSLDEATAVLGNEVHRLDHTNFATIFLGISLGILLGLLPAKLGWLPAPLRLGLAGGPLLVAVLISRLGKVGPFVVNMPENTNRALRELGIILFLACVGLLAGEHFFETVFTGAGLKWVGLGAIVTLAPLLIVGFVCRRFGKMNYMSISGLLSGSMTDPPALAFATSLTNSDSPAVTYATVYPLTMILRIVVAQLIALLVW